MHLKKEETKRYTKRSCNIAINTKRIATEGSVTAVKENGSKSTTTSTENQPDNKDEENKIKLLS